MDQWVSEPSCQQKAGEQKGWGMYLTDALLSCTFFTLQHVHWWSNHEPLGLGVLVHGYRVSSSAALNTSWNPSPMFLGTLGGASLHTLQHTEQNLYLEI